MFTKRRTTKSAHRKNQADGLDMSDWRSIVGRHSIMLALEPRFMFDGAGAEVADPTADAGGVDADVPDGQADGGDDTVTVFNNGFGTFDTGDGDDPDELALAVGSSATSGVSLSEDGSKLISDIEITGGEDTDVVKVEISLGNGGENKVDFDFNPNDFQGSGIWGEGNIDRSRQDEGIITVWGTRSDINKLLDTLTFEGGKDVYTKAPGGIDSPETMTVALYSCEDDGTVKELLHTADPILITINEVNDITVIEVPKVDGVSIGQIIGYEDEPLLINDSIRDLAGKGLGVCDPDDLDGQYVVEFELSKDWGKLTFGPDLDNDGILDGVWSSAANGKYTYTASSLDEIQALIDSLTYEAPDEDSGNVSLKISIYDDRTAVADRSKPVTIDIKITEVNDDPVFKDTLPPDFLAMDDVSEGMHKDFTGDMFNLTDIDNSDAHLVITVGEAPRHGTIQKKVGSTYVDILQGESFTYQDVLDGLIRYQHNGGQVRSDGGVGDDFHFTDSFTFSVNDGAGGFLNSAENSAHKGVEVTDPVTGITKTIHTFDISLKPVNQAPGASVGVDDRGEPGDVAYDIYEGQEEFPIIFDITDDDQLAANDYQVKITDISGLDGKLYFNGNEITAADVAAGLAVFDYADILAGKLRFTHDGEDGYDGVMGKTRDTGFKFEVIDDGGGTGVRASTEVELTFHVMSNNDNPYFREGLVEKDGVITVGNGSQQAQVGKGTGPDNSDSWLIQMGQGLDKGGFNIGDVDSKGKDITYTLVEQPQYGTVWIKTGDNAYIRLKAGESFTQAQIDAGIVYFATTARDTYTETSIKVTVRDGSLTAWAKEVDANGNDVRDENGELIVHNGIEGAVGSFVNGEWKPTVVTIAVKYYVKTGGESPAIEEAPVIYMGSDPAGSKTVLEGKETSLDGVLNGYYVDQYGNRIDSNHEHADYAADPEQLLYRLETKLNYGTLWLTDGNGNDLRQLFQYDSFSQADLANIVYSHDGSENFTETFQVTLTDGSINLTESFNSPTIKYLTVTIDVTPGNDTPEVVTEDLLVTEGAESHQDGETGFDRNGSVIRPENIGITDPDGNGDISKAGSDWKSSDTDFTFAVQKPGFGDIWVWVGPGEPDNALIDANPEKSLDEFPGWRTLTAAEYANSAYDNAGALKFTNEQLKNGYIRYVHDGRDPSQIAGDEGYRGGSYSDALEFRVYDGKGFEEGDGPDGYHHQSWTDATLTIKISNVNDKPRDFLPVDPDREFHTPENANRNPNYTGQANIASDDTGTKITNDYLHYVDAEKGAASLQYYIDKAPVNGTLYLFDSGTNTWKAIGQGAKFTQKDIDNGYVKYVHNGTETHSDSFTWTLRDGDENSAKWVTNQVFDIHVDPTNNPPEIATKPNEAKQDPSDRYVYVTPPDVTGGKDLGGVFQVSDRDYLGDGKGVPDGADVIEASLTSSIAALGGDGKYTQGPTLSGDLFIDLTGLSAAEVQALFPSGLKISTDGGQTYVELSTLAGTEAGKASNIMLKGSMDDVNAALNLLHYRPDTDSNSPGFCDDKTANIRIEVNDLGNGDVKGDNALSAMAEIAEMQMYINVDNKPPVLTGVPADGSLVMKEDNGNIEIKNVADWLKFTDEDPMPDWARNELTLTVEYGSLAFGASTAAITSKPVGNTRVYTLTGSLAEINAALTGLAYTPNLDYNGTAEVTLHFQDNISDDGVVDASFDIKVTPVNDKPTLDGTGDIIVIGGVGVSNEVGEDLAIAISDRKDTSGPAMDNTDNPDRNVDMTVTLTLERDVAASDNIAGGDGKLVLADKYGVTVTQSVDNILVLKGKEADIVKLLQELKVEINENQGVYTLNVLVDDHDNGGSEGFHGTVDKDFTFIVTSGSTKPQTTTGGNRTTDEDVSVDNLGIVVDSKCVGGADIMQVTVEVVDYGTPANAGTGTLTLDKTGLPSSLTIVPADAASSKTFVITGTEAEVNAALAKLVYKPGTHDNAVDGLGDPAGADKVKVSVVDKFGYPGSDSNLTGDPVYIDIAIRPVNDAPVVNAPGTPVDMGSIDEDILDASNTGKTVTELFNSKFNDNKDAQAGGSGRNNLAGVIVTADGATSAQGTWQYLDPAGNGGLGEWKDITVGMYLGAKVSIRFEPTADYNGPVGQLSVRLVDDSAQESHNPQHDAVPGTGESGIYNNDLGYYIKEGYVYTVPAGSAATNDNTSRYSNATVGLTVTVTPVNDAPVVADSTPVTVDAYEDVAGTGKKVSELIPAGTYFSDPGDAGSTNGHDSLAGVVVKAVDNNSHGKWQYSIDGATWTDITAAGTDGVYLDLNAYIRFNPTATAGGVEHFNGDPGASLVVHLFETDGGSGKTADAPADGNTYTTGQTVSFAATGDKARISDGTVTLNAVIHAINDAPVVDKTHNPSATVTLPTISEDADKATNPGYKVEDLFNAGGNSANALFSDPRDNIGGIDGSVSNGFAGILVVGNTATSTQGEWQYCDKDGNWKDINTLLAGGNYAYLASDAQIRFQPAADFNGSAPDLVVRLVDDSSDYAVNADNPNLPTLAANVTYASIAAAGFKSGGTTRYSADTVTVTVAVTPVNDAPTINGPANGVTVAEDHADNAGVTVGSVFGGSATFSDAKDAQTGNGGSSTANDFHGVIIKGVTNGSHGVWQYESAPGVWTDIQTPPSGQGLFLEAGTNIRFSPKVSDGQGGWTQDHFNGDPGASLEVHLVETATDNSAFAASGDFVSIAAGDIGGTSRVSAGTVGTAATVTPVNDAPTLAKTDDVTVTVNEDKPGTGHTVGSLLDGYYNDATDADMNANRVDDDSMTGVFVVGVNDSKGTWQYLDGSTWKDIVIPSGKGLYLDTAAQIRFVPDIVGSEHFNGDPSSSIQVRLVENDANSDVPGGAKTYTSCGTYDITQVGGSTQISAGLVTIKAAVNAVNDAPSVVAPGSPSPLPTISEDIADAANNGSTVNSVFKDQFNDSLDDIGASSADGFAGVVIVGNTADKATQGAWQYKNELGKWVDIPTCTTGSTSFLYLSKDAEIRFNPAKNFNGTPPELVVRLADDSGVDLANNPDNTALPMLTGGIYGTVDNTGGSFAYGGTTRYSATTAKATVTVTPVNDAPTVDGAATDLTVTEDIANNAGRTVDQVFGSAFSDKADAQTANGGQSSANSFHGVIIKEAIDGDHGEWEYYDTGTSNWVSINDALDSDPGKGLFLKSGTQIRFSPKAADGSKDHFNGDPGASMEAYLVETSSDASDTSFSSSGLVSIADTDRGGPTRVSKDSLAATVAVEAVNDSPVRDGDETITVPESDLNSIGADAVYNGSVRDIFENKFDDSRDNQHHGTDNPDGSKSNSFDGIIITDINASNHGTWQYFKDGSWHDIDVGGTNNNLYLAADTELRFVANFDSFNFDQDSLVGSLTVRLVETVLDSGGNPAGDHAFTHLQRVADIALSPTNDANPYTNRDNQVILKVPVPKFNHAPALGGIADKSAVEQTPIRLAENGTILDAELSITGGAAGNWDGASLTVSRTDTQLPLPGADDIFGVDGGGNVELRTDGKVYVNGTAIGTYTNTGGSLSMTFNGSADNAAVKAVLGSLTYTYNGDCPPDSAITLTYTVNDGNRGIQGAGGNGTHSVEQHIVVAPVPDPATPNDDSNSVSVDYAYSANCNGNVLENDTHPDIQRGLDPTADLEVVSVDGTPIAGRTAIQGQYGTLYIDSDGSYTYVADKDNPDVAALGAGGSLEEVFTYEAKDAAYGGTDMNGTADLVITITATGRIPPAEPPMLEEPKNPGIPDPVVPEAPGIRDSDVDKPVISTVDTAAQDSNSHLNTTIDRLGGHLNESALPPSLDSLDALRHNSWSLDEPMLFGNTDQKSATIEEAHEFNLPDDLFVHTRPNERLIYSATLSDGSELPEWMNFDPEQFCISCTPPAGSEGSVEVIIQAEDRRGLKAEATVTIKIGEEEELNRLRSMAEADVDAEASGEAENAGDAEEATETPNEELTFAGEWLMLEAEAGADGDAAAAEGTHPGLRSQINATGSTALLGEARQLRDTLIGSR